MLSVKGVGTTSPQIIPARASPKIRLKMDSSLRELRRWRPVTLDDFVALEFAAGVASKPA